MGEVPDTVTKKYSKIQQETQFQKIIAMIPQKVEVITVGQQDMICTELEQKIG